MAFEQGSCFFKEFENLVLCVFHGEDLNQDSGSCQECFEMCVV